MRTIRRLLYRDILASVAFVALAFLSLFFFIDFVDRLGDLGSGGRTLATAVLSAAYELPGRLYELMPIALLIGTIYSLARMAQSSEFTILRTGGLGPVRALGLLAVLGLAFGVLTFVIGDYVAPLAERASLALRAELQGGLRAGSGSGAGAWLKERRPSPQGEVQVSINVGSAAADGSLKDVLIFEFDTEGRLRTRVQAQRAQVNSQGTWRLQQVQITRWPPPPGDISVRATPAPSAAAAPPSARTGKPAADVQVQQFDAWDYPSSLTPDVVAAAVLPLGSMSTLELWRYSRHLSVQEQATARYDILFWKKALYPLACLVMVGLALPFAYLHARAGSVSLKVFGGIMMGISFVLMNNLAGHIGLLRGWTPWLAASTPSLLFLALSLAAFAWLVRYR